MPAPDSYMRLIYARGVSRPERNVAGGRRELGHRRKRRLQEHDTVSFGNPNLKAEAGDDIDVLHDHYFKTFGVLSGGYFFKHLASPPFSTQKVLDNYLPLAHRLRMRALTWIPAT